MMKKKMEKKVNSCCEKIEEEDNVVHNKVFVFGYVSMTPWQEGKTSDRLLATDAANTLVCTYI